MNRWSGTWRHALEDSYQPYVARLTCCNERGSSQENYGLEQESITVEVQSGGPARSLRRSTRSKRSRQPPPALRTVPEEDEVVEDDPRTESHMETIAEDESPELCVPGEASEGTQATPTFAHLQKSIQSACLQLRDSCEWCADLLTRYLTIAHV